MQTIGTMMYDFDMSEDALFNTVNVSQTLDGFNANGTNDLDGLLVECKRKKKQFETSKG